MNARVNDVCAVALVTVVSVVCAMTLPSTWLRMLAGLLLVCFLPGHAILRALHAGRQIDLTAIVFAGGLSIAATILCGLALNLVGPLTPARWTIALGAITLAACGIAYARGRRVPAAPRAPIGLPTLRVGQALMLVCSGAIVAATVMWMRHDLLAHPEFAYTELWMTPDARGGAITIGFRNAERLPTAYDLEVALDGGIVAVRRSVALRVGESWTSDFALPMRNDETHIAEARLFRRGDDRLVYRRVWLKTGSQEP